MREVVWTRGAEADLLDLYQRLDETNSESALRLLQLIDAAVELLRQFPEMARMYDSPVRRLVIRDGRHGLFYTVEARGVILHAVADLRGNPEELKRRFRRLKA
jgi:plasmid stabilization system protein ParE